MSFFVTIAKTNTISVGCKTNMALDLQCHGRSFSLASNQRHNKYAQLSEPLSHLMKSQIVQCLSKPMTIIALKVGQMSSFEIYV